MVQSNSSQRFITPVYPFYTLKIDILEMSFQVDLNYPDKSSVWHEYFHTQSIYCLYTADCKDITELFYLIDIKKIV